MTETLHPWQHPESKEIHVDYCIVGGGVSGLYAAVRLSQAEDGPEPPRICILEATKRIGGRMVSVDIPDSPFRADLGAMRFLPAQPLISSLVDHYGLATYDYQFPTDFFFVRGRRINPPEAENVYDSLRAHEKNQTPGQLVIYAVSRVLQEVRVDENAPVPGQLRGRIVNPANLNKKLAECANDVRTRGFKAFTPMEWRTIKLYGKYPPKGGPYLYQLGLWDVVQSQLSAEAYSFVEDGLGYQTIIGTWNAADAIPWFLSDFSDLPYRSIVGGMGEIPRHLYGSFLDSMKQRRDLIPFHPALVVFQETKVQRVCWHEADKSVVIDADVTVAAGVAPWRVKASHCLICVSQGAVERIKFAMTAGDGISPIDDLRNRSMLMTAGARGLSAPAAYVAKPERDLIGRAVNAYQVDFDYNFDWLLNCVERQPLLKMFLAFKHAWWERVWQTETENSAKVPEGFKVLTNLPLRQLFYHFSTSLSHQGPAAGEQWVPGTGDGMIMAYCDAKHATYWDALAFRERLWYTSAKYEKDTKMVEDLTEFGVSRILAERAHEQIWRVHRGLVKSDDLDQDMREVSEFTRDDAGNRQTIAKSKTVLFKNWMSPPFYGGWHSWRIGVVSDDAKKIWERPWLEANIYFAGEVMSSDQGWSEGAFRSVERILLHQLAKARPPWRAKVGSRDAAGAFDLDERAKDLGFTNIEDYVDW